MLLTTLADKIRKILKTKEFAGKEVESLSIKESTTSESSLFDSMDLTRFAKVNVQIVSNKSSSLGLVCTTITTLDPSPNNPIIKLQTNCKQIIYCIPIPASVIFQTKEHSNTDP